MFKPGILLKQHFPLAALTLDIADHPWRTNAAYDALVATTWQSRVAQAAARGHHLWDGTHFRLTHIEDAAAPGRLRLGTVAFRYIATWRLLQAEHAAHALEPFHHISTAALVRTADGDYVFGKRAINGAIDLIGGGFQQDDGVAGIAENFAKEIHEELGVPSAALGAMTGLGIVRSGSSNVLVIAQVPVRLSNAELLAAFARREDDEMAEPVFVPAAELSQFLLGLTDYRRLIPDLISARL